MQLREQVKNQQIRITATDDVLVQQSLAGDHSAFETLVHRYSTPLCTFIGQFLNDAETGSDVLQHVFIQLYLSLPKLRIGEPLKAWLLQVARNRCLDELRRKRVLHFSELQSFNEDEDSSPVTIIPDTGPLPEDVAEHHDVQRILQEAIAGLPPKFRAVVLLRYGQLSFSEIGHILHIPEATAKTYFQRAKPMLRATLKQLFLVSSAC